MPRTTLLAAVLLLLLGGCMPASSVRMDDVYVYGAEDARYSYFYGEAGQLLYEGRTIALTEPAPDAPRGSDPLVVPAALLVDGRPYLREPLEPLATPPVTVGRRAFTTDLQVSLGADVEEVVYYDGQSFLTLLKGGEAGTVQGVVPRPRLNRLRGLGQLGSAEADALAAALTARGKPFALALLPVDSLPAHAVDGLSEHRRTGVYVQLDVSVAEGSLPAAPTELPWEVVARGNQAVGFSAPTYRMVGSQEQLITLWQRAYGSQLTVPALPEVDPRRETVVALFLGSKPTGGYGIDVVDAREEGGQLYLDVSLTEPGQGTLTTQALTSPWLIVRVLRGGYQAVWLRDVNSGGLLGVARREP